MMLPQGAWTGSRCSLLAPSPGASWTGGNLAK